MGFIGRGQAKLLLFGEHAAVYGFPALGMALPEYTEVDLEPKSGSTGWDITGIADHYRALIAQLLSRLEENLDRLHGEGSGAAVRGHIEGTSSVPLAVGFGSSAAVCVAVAHAAECARNAGEAPSTRVTWELANRLEKLFHGTPSGIDTGLAALGGVQAFRFHGDELPEAERLSGGRFFIVAGALPRSTGTKELVAGIREKMEQNDRTTTESLSRLGEISERAIEIVKDAMTEADLTELGTLASEAHQRLSSLGLSTALLDRFIQIGMTAGAVGGKVSGAGGGGAFYLFYRNEEQAQDGAARIRDQLSASGHAVAPVYAVSVHHDRITQLGTRH